MQVPFRAVIRVALYAFVLMATFAIHSSSAKAAIVRISVENVGSVGTTFVTPIFVGLHDGSYDLSNGGTATAGLESLAELGMTGGLTGEFLGGDASRMAATLGAGGPIAPGTSFSHDFNIDLTSGANTRVTLASMILPSSDFFLGNISTPAFDISGLTPTAPLEFTLSSIYDAGTELNDFATSPGNPLLGLPGGNALMSADDMDTSIRLVGADPFNDFLTPPPGGFSPNLSQLRVTVSAVPEPSTTFAGCLAVAGLLVHRRRKNQKSKAAKATTDAGV